MRPTLRRPRACFFAATPAMEYKDRRASTDKTCYRLRGSACNLHYHSCGCTMNDNQRPPLDIIPEAWAAFQHQLNIDYDAAGPKAPVASFDYRGVHLESRWAVLRELETMKRIVDALPELTARRLNSIWCDSNCEANYVVSIRPGLWVPSLGDAIANAVMTGGGGHNGIMIDEAGDHRTDIGPDWDED